MPAYLRSAAHKSSCIKWLLSIALLIGILFTAPLTSNAQMVYASSQDNGVTGLCVLCGVTNPANPISNANLNDYSTFTVTAGLLGVSVYQDLIFPGVNPDLGCDSLVVGIGNSSALLSASLLGGVTIQTYNGTTANGDVTSVTTSDLLLLSSDTTRGDVYIHPTKAFDRVRITLSSSLVGALSGFRLFFAYTAPTVLTLPTLSGGSTVTVCSGTAATLTATASDPVASLNWFSQSSGGTAIHNGSTYTVSPAATTTYYVESDLGSCSSPSRTAVTVQVNPLPTTPVLVNAAVTVCSGNPATFTVSNPPANETYNWYTVATGGTPIATGTSFTTPAATASQDYFLEGVTATSGCASGTRATAALMVNPTPDSTSIVGSASVTVNQGQTATFVVNAPNAAYTYNWYDAPAGGNLVFTGTSFTTPPIYAPTSYYVSAVSNQGCTSSTITKVSVYVLTSNNITCGLATTQQSPEITGVCALCSVSNPNLAVDGDPSTASTITASVGATGYVGQLLGFPNTYPAGDSIILDLSIPGQLVSATLLGGIKVQTYLNGTANNDAELLNAPTARLQLLGGGSQFQIIIPAQNTFNGVLVSISGTVSLLSSLDVYYAAALVPRPTVASNLLNLCGPGADSLFATGPAGATFNWYTVPTGGTSLDTGMKYVTPVLTANTTYYLESSQFGCANSVRTPVTVDINTPPAAPLVPTSSVTICSGDSATLTATVPAGVSVKWYTQATGGTAVDSGATFTTPALTATTIYYAAAADNGCTSATRTAVTVTVNQSPATVSVTPASTTISQGQSAVFTASSATSGVQFNWYTQSTGGAPVYTGATYTSVPTSTITYYVSAVNPTTGCSTLTRTAVTVTVLSGGGPAVPCGAATSEISNVNGLCIGCSVQNETLAVDGNANTGSTLQVTAGLVGAYASQTLVFPFTADAGDSVQIKIVMPSSILNASVLGSIEVATYNGTTYNNDLQSINTAPITLNLLAGSDSAIVTFAPSSPYDRVMVQLNSGAVGLITTVNIDYAASEKPAPQLVSDTVTICSGSQATLKVTSPPDATFNWYSSASGGSPLFTGPTFVTPVLTDTTDYYVQSTATVNGCINSSRTTVLVDVPAPPATPTLQQSNPSVCLGSSATLIAKTPVGAMFSWYTTAIGGSPIYTGDTLITPVLDSSVTYYVAALSSAGCTSTTRTAVTVNIVAAPVAPVVAPAADTICSGGTAQLVASSTTPGVQFSWYSSATADTALFSGPTFTTPVLDTTTTYYVSTIAGTCSSPTRATATVIVNPLPAAPTIAVVPASATVNSGSTAVLTAASSTPNAVINWYTTSTGGSAVYTGNTFTTPALTTTVTYYAEAEGNNGAGCPSTTRTAITITVIPAVNLSCGVANSEVNQINGLCIGCTVTNPGNAVDLDTTTYASLSIGASVAGSVQETLIFPEVSQPGDSIQVELSTPGNLLSASVLGAIQVSTADGATSNNDAISLQSSTVTVTVGSSGTQALFRFAPQHPYDRFTVTLSAGVVSALTALNIYYATDQVDAPVVATPNVTICAGMTATLKATTSVNATVEWFSVPTGGTALSAGDTLTTPALTQTTTYYAEALRIPDSCANLNRVPVTVSVLAPPAVPLVTHNPDTICSGQNAVLQASAAMNTTLQWYDSSNGGNLLYTGTIFTTPALTANKSYFVVASNGTCSSPSRDSVFVLVGQVPSIPNVQPTDTSICAGQSVTLAVAQPQAGVVYYWYTLLSGGSPVSTGNIFTTPVLATGVTYYVEAVNSASLCTAPSARTAVTISVTPAPATPAVVISPVTICAGGSATLQVQSPINGVLYTWYPTDTGGIALFQGSSINTGPLQQGTSYFVSAAISGAGCASASRSQDSVQLSAPPATPVLVNSDVTICAGNTATLTVQSPQAGITYLWLNSPTSTTPLFAGNPFTIIGDTASGVYYVEASTSGGCSSTSQSVADVTVNPLPANPSVAVPNTTVCPASTATFTVTNPVPGETYSWYATSSGGTAIATGTSFTSPVLAASASYYVGVVSAGGCNSSGLTMVSATVANNLTPPQLVTSPVNDCTGQPAVFSVSNPQGGITYNWYDSVSGGNLLNQGTSYTLNNPTAGDTFYVASSASGGTCSSAARTSAVLVIVPPPASPIVLNPGAQVCSGGNIALQVSNPVSGTLYNWYDSASGGTPVFTGSIYTINDDTATATYYVDATANGCSSSSRTPVMVTLATPAGDPTVAAAANAVCPGDNAILTATSTTTGATYGWYTSPTGDTSVAAGSTFTTGPLTSDTTFYVSAASTQGCSDTTRTAVTITQLQPLSPPTVTVQSRNSTSVTFEWTPVAGAVAYQISLDSGVTFVTPTSGPTGTTETITGLSPNQTASIEVKALGASSCQISTASGLASGVSGNPLGDNIFVPNVFSPNGDGVNDVLYVFSNAVYSLVFRIYNQWGQEVFESRSMSNGWDGTMSGQKQPVGVYIYTLQATMQDGTLVNKKGSVTLIR